LREIVRNIGARKTRKKNSFDVSSAEYSSHEITVVLTGIGIRNAENALEYVLKEQTPDVIVAAGFGGALYDGARIGEVIWASRVLSVSGSVQSVIDLQAGRDMFNRLSGQLALREGSVVTLDTWNKKAEVRRMVPEEFPFPVCDMETFPLARLSLERDLSFFAFRSITDRGDEEIPPELLGVSDESGQYRLSRALKLLITKPWLIAESMKLGAHSQIAGRNLWQAVSAFIKAL
jgi:nucleoside phosphorylase